MPLDVDEEHATYNPEQVSAYFEAAGRAAMVLTEFRAPYRGRSTPVNAWWGSFDLAVSLFSGRPAEPPSGDFIMRNAMDAQEVAVGWWPGDPRHPAAAFYAYAHPAPPGYGDGKLAPKAAHWDAGLGEYVLNWDDVRASDDPHAAALEFARSAFTHSCAMCRWDPAPGRERARHAAARALARPPRATLRAAPRCPPPRASGESGGNRGSAGDRWPPACRKLACLPGEFRTAAFADTPGTSVAGGRVQERSAACDPRHGRRGRSSRSWPGRSSIGCGACIMLLVVAGFIALLLNPLVVALATLARPARDRRRRSDAAGRLRVRRAGGGLRVSAGERHQPLR